MKLLYHILGPVASNNLYEANLFAFATKYGVITSDWDIFLTLTFIKDLKGLRTLTKKNMAWVGELFYNLVKVFLEMVLEIFYLITCLQITIS
mgnify:CR=1 FL=1